MKEKKKFSIMLLFTSPLLICSLAYYMYGRIFSNNSALSSIPKEALDQIRYYTEISINIFFILLYVYLFLLYTIMQKQKLKQ
jgi:uncharacterized BrkB/YihY/UPF0761 family membrane protein